MTSKVLLAGSSGLIGTEIKTMLESDKHYEVHQLVRRKPAHEREHFWDPQSDVLEADLLKGFDSVISLNGASVGKLPWTKKYQKELYDSRINPTKLLAKTFLELGKDAPKQWISGSAVGFYGSAPGKKLTETSTPGDTFLAKLCVAWEAEALAASEVTNVALLRTAPVLHPDGVLKPLILLTKLGVAGPIAGGKQKFAWISLRDEARAIVFILQNGLAGPFNLTAQTVVSSNDVGRALAKQLRRPFLLPVPGFALNLVLGRPAVESLLTPDAAVYPQALVDAGFEFLDETPAAAIGAALGAS